MLESGVTADEAVVIDAQYRNLVKDADRFGGAGRKDLGGQFVVGDHDGGWFGKRAEPCAELIRRFAENPCPETGGAGDAEGPLQTAFRKVKYLRVEGGPIVQSKSGDVKVMEMPFLELDAPTNIRGTNVGYDPVTDNGIAYVDFTFEGKTWRQTTIPKEAGFEADEADFQPASEPEYPYPEAGEYNMKIVFHRNGGSEGGEDLVTYGKVTVTQ